MVFISENDQASFKKVLKEFNNLTNEEAYVHIFSQRIMAPLPNRIGEYLGCDQRIDFLPSLQKLIAKVPENGQVFDVGAGAGDIVDFALKDIAPGTVIHLEDPNPSLLRKYLKKLKNFRLNRGIIYEGPLQDYYQGKKQGVFPQQPQNLILAVHMIYQLTDFTQPKIDPQKDLIEAFSFLYQLLAPGGSIFIVYADLLPQPHGEAIASLGEKYFRHHHPTQPFADHILAIYQARNQLLGPKGSIATILAERFPQSRPSFQSERHPTYFFGETLGDIGAMALAAELCPSDAEKFNLSKLQFCLEYVTKHPERLGIRLEERDVPQKGLWRANEPQVIAILTKES